MEALLVDEECTCCCTQVAFEQFHLGRIGPSAHSQRMHCALQTDELVLAPLAPELELGLVLERLELAAY